MEAGRWQMLSDRAEFLISRASAALVVLVLLTRLGALAVTAQSSCEGGVSLSLDRRLNVKSGGYNGLANVCDYGGGGFTTTLRGESVRGPDVTTSRTFRSEVPSGGWVPNAGANPLDLIRLFCRRDDYAFLPQGASGGLPCTSTTSGATIDPGEVARELFGRLSLPSLRLDMNPRLGLVAVPTWFWVEGY